MRRYAWIALLVLLTDQLTKALARSMTGSVVLIPGILGLRYCENTGMAFSLFSGMPWLLGLLSVAVVAAGIGILRGYRLGGLSRTAAMLILGGAAGNALDRLLLGSVTDMIEMLFVRFAVFNIADAALTVGCGLMALSLLTKPGEWEKKQRSPL